MKIQYEERLYTRDAHGHGKEGTEYRHIGVVSCCDSAKGAWNSGMVFEFNEYEGEFFVNIFEKCDSDYESGCYSDRWENEIKFCPWCAAPVTFECAKKTKVEYDCTEVVEKRMVCNERIEELQV